MRRFSGLVTGRKGARGSGQRRKTAKRRGKRGRTLGAEVLEVLNDAGRVLLDAPRELGQELDLAQQAIADAGTLALVKDERARHRLRHGVAVALALRQLLPELGDRHLEPVDLVRRGPDEVAQPLDRRRILLALDLDLDPLQVLADAARAVVREVLDCLAGWWRGRP